MTPLARRQRKIGPRTSPYVAIPDSIEIRSNSILIDVRNTRNDVVFVVEFNAIEDSTSRLRIREKNPLRPRYEVDGALVGEPKLQKSTKKYFANNKKCQYEMF